MIKSVIIVDSLPETVKAWGIEAMDNTIFQEMGGNYWFVDVDEGCERVKEAKARGIDCDSCENDSEADGCMDGYIPCKQRGQVNCEMPPFPGGFCLDCLKPLPLKIAHLIMQFIKAQQDISMVSVPTLIERPSKLKAYIPAGVSFSVNGEQVEPIEIPANLGVVHVEET